MDLYSTSTLQALLLKTDEFSPYLTNFFCPNEFTFETEKVMFDKVFEDNTIAPYVSPMVAGKVNRKDGFSTMEFAVPYVKDLDQITAEDGVKRSAGEAITGSLSIGARIAAARGKMLMRHKKRLSVRIEEQVSQLIKGGVVVCEGEGHPSVQVDFGMSAANDITVVGAARWSQLDPATNDGQQILDDLEDWSANSNVGVSRALFEKSVWKHIIKFSAVRELRDTTIRGETTSFSVAPVTNNEEIQYRGTLGTLDCWVYTGFYTAVAADGTKSKVTFLDTGRLVLSGNKPNGAVAFGAIKDMHNLSAVKQFSKNYTENNPSAENLLSQSSPLAALPDIDSIVTIQTDGGA